MSGAGSMSAMNASLSNNKALLKKRRLKNNPYLSADRVTRQGKADYQELKAWRLGESKRKSAWRKLVALVFIGMGALTLALVFLYNFLGQ